MRSNAEKSFSKSTQEKRVKEEKKIAEGRGCVLAEEIKELEMVDAYDDDHIMDIEEALQQNSAGQVVAVAAKKLGVRWGADCAEAAAALYGLEIARCLGHSRVILECDALNVISAIKRNVVGFSPVFLFYEDIRRLKYCFEFLDYIHIRRSSNVVAHCVARWDFNVGEKNLHTNKILLTNGKQAKIAESAGACCVIVAESIQSGILRMPDPGLVKEVKRVVSIPVMAKARVGHFVEGQILEAVEVHYIDKSEVMELLMRNILLTSIISVMSLSAEMLFFHFMCLYPAISI
ncbi:hypothetical protein POM88_000227 [Heracleum sosnowskyi]|uniref:RNase H type-1 domain-containing protein n=1 Tax=Heracleum sosnowskyi TaxID=360622 RepID=A0AAD8N949_9APIA|nr:hypothetical protein POM88_000227 [Heracleum sosnowskyi]